MSDTTQAMKDALRNVSARLLQMEDEALQQKYAAFVDSHCKEQTKEGYNPCCSCPELHISESARYTLQKELNAALRRVEILREHLESIVWTANSWLKGIEEKGYSMSITSLRNLRFLATKALEEQPYPGGKFCTKFTKEECERIEEAMSEPSTVFGEPESKKIRD